MNNFLSLDFETRSMVELGGSTSVGLHNYACHPSTEALMLAWAYGEEPVELWQPRIGSMGMPERLRRGLDDPTQLLVSWNSSFERYILQFVLGITVPAERFVDPQVSARYLSLSGDLDTVSEILGLPQDQAKDKEGHRLIQIFSKPTVKKKRGQEPVVSFRNWDSDPEDWQKFCDYCKRDVIAEREILRRLTLLEVYPLPEKEQKFWAMDQAINDRGIPVDVDFVRKALALATREKKEAIEKQNELTGLENANSNSQMLAWAKQQGFEGNSLRKEAVASQLKYSTTLTPLGRKVLEARKACSSTSYKKLAAILRQVSPDGRLRNQFIFMGAARTGRWSGNAAQLQNLARAEERFEDEDTMNEARAMIYAEDYDGIKAKFGSVLLVVKSLIRTVFVAKEKRFVIADLSSIETRVGAWIAGCDSLLDVFRKGHDVYLDFAVKMTQIPYENLERDIHSKDSAVKSVAKRHRQIAKPGVLGCIYRLGGGGWGTNKYGDTIKTGLWGYAEAMGVEMTQEKAHEVVKVFRNSYLEIPQCWYAFEEAIADVLNATGDRIERRLGPNGCILVDKMLVQGRYPLLRIQLPSGRRLHYLDAHLEPTLMPWKDAGGKDVYKNSLCYAGQDQITKVWTEITAHGGKTFEQATQGIARDVIAEDLLACEPLGLDVDGHAHDEIIAESDDDPFAPSALDMEYMMGQEISWAPGLPLAAAGFDSPFYKKN